MWLMTTFGFFSIVQKPNDTMLTIRARVKSDLENLRKQYLPTLGEIEEHTGTDYEYRARASKEAVSEAVRRIALHIDYGNFKDTVNRRQGRQRASLYGKVWTDLQGLQREEKPSTSR
jgi:hypothetical protein